MISVIIPTYNRANLIERAVMSVFNQSFSDKEIIVVDDASADETESVIRKLDIPFLRYIKLPQNSGACHARNVGIQESQGEYISFLDSDDTWEVTKLEEQFNFLKDKSADVVVCNYWTERNGEKKLRIKQNHKLFFTKNELLNANTITTGSLLVSRKVFDKVGLFDELMPRYQDWELVLRIERDYKIYFLDKPLLTLFYQENSITNSTSKAKKFYALDRMMEKNKEDMLLYPKAFAHHCWSMGMYSLYMGEIRWDLLKKGVFGNGLYLRRLCIYLMLRCGFIEVIKRQYAKNH